MKLPEFVAYSEYDALHKQTIAMNAELYRQAGLCEYNGPDVSWPHSYELIAGMLLLLDDIKVKFPATWERALEFKEGVLRAKEEDSRK